MSDFERVARIIEYMDAAHRDQPDLAALARRAGLSPHHFHRLFTTWAGVTPKDFLQCLTLADARARLRDGESVLGAALAAGLSGPGRLHDLCVSLEAASPGEIKSGGSGWTVRAGIADSPFGQVVVGEGPRGICALSFVNGEPAAVALDAIRRDWPGADIVRDDAAARRIASAVFAGPGSPAASAARPLRAFVRGTPFQVRVWRALLRVEAGSVVSYGALAAAIGDPGASRAVGTAVGRNPIACLIPCHRVIRQTGVVGEYRWGTTRKRALLAFEGAAAGARPAHPRRG